MENHAEPWNTTPVAEKERMSWLAGLQPALLCPRLQAVGIGLEFEKIERASARLLDML
jgi:hypothetical protein